MAMISQRATLTVEAHFVVSEQELRALYALAGYGDDAFIKAFYEKLGRAYMESHEEGLRSFLVSIRALAPGILRRLDDARKIFHETSDQRHERLNPPARPEAKVPD